MTLEVLHIFERKIVNPLNYYILNIGVQAEQVIIIKKQLKNCRMVNSPLTKIMAFSLYSFKVVVN